MKRILASLVAALACLSLLSQKDCPQGLYQQQLSQQFPRLGYQYEQIEQFSDARRAGVNNRAGEADSIAAPSVPANIIIPVVVHIVWNTTVQQVSNAQVLSQIAILNSDFNALNDDRSKIPVYFRSSAAGCGISFALAKTDPQGNPSTGILRRQTKTTSFSFDDKVKNSATGGDDAWDAGSYLNIWVCNLESGISGYASLPGGPAARDGVVISSSAFGTSNNGGPYNKGRTAVHEAGHWLNLRHIWGDTGCGDDKVDDTPAQQGASRGCNSGEKFSCGSSPHGDMYMNFMDFSDDACMYMFTKGQRERMRVLFEPAGPRNSLLSSRALAGEGLAIEAPEPAAADNIELALFPNPAAGVVTLQLKNSSSSLGKKIYVYNQLGQLVQTKTAVSKLQQMDISRLAPGLYFVKMEGDAGSGMKKFIRQ